MILEIKIRWLGHASFLVEGGGKTIYIDPWIEGNPKCPMKLDEIEGADYICVTHGHDDHIGDSLEIAKRTGGILVCGPEIAIYADKRGIKYDEGSCPLNIGGTMRGEGLEITMVDAVHTSDILGEEFKRDGTVVPGSGCCGYIMKFSDGPTIYYAGDTGVFGDMAIYRHLYGPQIAILPIGGKYNMGVREAVYATFLIGPDVVIPMHYDTFPNQRADIEEFTEKVGFLSPKTKVVAIKPGETYEYRTQ
ncbi:MAG: metal-dependent hydrolase [bacterium]